MTFDDLIKEAAREGNMRRAVYPKSEGKPETKAHRLACMDAIERVLKAIAADPAMRAELERKANIEPPHPTLL
jgi:hypothetical protein